MKEYLAAAPQNRQELLLFLHNYIQKAVPKLKVYFATNMIGYGSFPYKNYKKETINWPIIALANQKQYVSVYVCSVIDGEYVAEKYKKELGKVKVGRSCISIKKLEEINLPTFGRVLKEAQKNPGLAM